MFEKINKKLWQIIGEGTDISFRVEFLDGSIHINKPKKKPVVSLVYKRSRAYRRILLFSDVGLAEAYLAGDIDVVGDISQLVLIGDEASRNSQFQPLAGLNTVRNYWHELRFGNRNIAQAKRNALSHYGLGTEMFRQYLDPTMTYTCAYWTDSTKNVAEAQLNKIDHTLKKLQLKRGETLVDVGGGWGSVLFRAHEKYGVKGVNVSPTPDQNKALRKEIKRRGLQTDITVKEIDFREDTGRYDKYISLGVYEHAGKGQLDDWIRVMSNTLKPGGIGVLHFIGNIRGNLDDTGVFIRKHIFPGGYLPGLAETVEIMDKYDLEVLDIENLRRHYAKTLAAWAKNFDKNWEAIHRLDPKAYNEAFRRRWRLYLHACSSTFLKKHSSSIGLFQIVFSKGREHNYPMTRDFLYHD